MLKPKLQPIFILIRGKFHKIQRNLFNFANHIFALCVYPIFSDFSKVCNRTSQKNLDQILTIFEGLATNCFELSRNTVPPPRKYEEKCPSKLTSLNTEWNYWPLFQTIYWFLFCHVSMSLYGSKKTCVTWQAIPLYATLS